MMILKRKFFSKLKYPTDWSDDDWDYMDKIKKNEEKRLGVNVAGSALGGAAGGTLRSILFNKKKSAKSTLSGAALGGFLGYAFNKPFLDSRIKDEQDKYRKIKSKKDRDFYIRENKNKTKILDTLSPIDFI